MWARSQLKEQDLRFFARDARDYALLHGLVMRYPTTTSDNQVGHIPFTMFPTPFPKGLYKECLGIQPAISELMLKIANDGAFMESTLSEIIKVDDFTENLISINRTVQREGLAQPVIACINRSDYMLNKCSTPGSERFGLLQVEVNAISSAMSAHSRTTKLLHEYLMNKYRISLEHERYTLCMPDNESLEGVVQGLIDAFDCYGKQDGFILLVAEERSFNFSDQFQIELMLLKKRPDVRMVRRRFVDLPNDAKLGPNKELLIDEGRKEINVVYFRYCYDPSHHAFKGGWNLRLLIERSRAIKCPSINFHLSGAKKFQQVLSNEESLERYLNHNDARKMMRFFCKIWSLESGTTEGQEGYKIGTSNPENYVLKPQREGGGHNIYGRDIKCFLEQKVSLKDRSQYILMEHINSPCEKNWILRYEDSKCDHEKLFHHDRVLSELGIYGSIVAEGYVVKANRTAGYLVRTKNSGVNEGGVGAGYAGISSLVLFDETRSDIDLSPFYDESW